MNIKVFQLRTRLKNPSGFLHWMAWHKTLNLFRGSCPDLQSLPVFFLVKRLHDSIPVDKE